MARVFRIICVVATLGSGSEAVIADTGTPRLPLCDITQVRSQPVESYEVGLRSAFCKTAKSKTCDVRWSNGEGFLRRAVADTRISDVSTISYMFGTIVAETEDRNFSPAATEVIDRSNENRDYVKDGFYGRGWIQLTYRDKYALASKVLNKDLVKHPELALEPDNAYEILYRGMTDGWIEVYRTSSEGAVAREVPVKLGDFVTSQGVNYELARAVINANCKKVDKKCSPPDVEVKPGLYLPPPTSLDVSAKAAAAATAMEKLLCGSVHAQLAPATVSSLVK